MEAMAVGNRVHYVLPSGAHRPAVVTQVYTATECDLVVFLAPGDTHHASGEKERVLEDPECAWGTWHVPEAVLA